MSQYTTGLARIISQAAPAAALVATDSGVGGGVNVGAHSWKFTWVDAADRETLPSPASNVVTVASSAKRVDLSAIAVGPGGTVKRRIYRTVAGDTAPWKLVGEITNNATTTYQDTIADASLTDAAPTAGTFASNLVRLTGGGTTVDTIPVNSLFMFQGDKVFSTVSSIVDDDEFTISEAYAGDLNVYPLDTDHAYVVHTGFTPFVRFLEPSANMVEAIAVALENVRRNDALMFPVTSSPIAHVDPSVVGNVGGGEDTLWSWSMPTDTLELDNDMVVVTVGGDLAGASSAKTIKGYFGATEVVARVETLTTGKWQLVMTIIRLTETTQDASGVIQYNGTSEIDSATPAETLTGAVLIKVTGASAGAVDNDIVKRRAFAQVFKP
jgi:hypothetical protein